MGNPTLTKLLFAGLIGTFFIATLFGNYVQFAVLNNASIEEPYYSAFANISAQYSEFEDVGGTIKDEGLVKNIFNAGASAVTGTVNIFVIGLESIGAFFGMIPVIGNVFEAISTAVPGFNGLVGLLTIILAIYVAMRYRQSASNTQELP